MRHLLAITLSLVFTTMGLVTAHSQDTPLRIAFMLDRSGSFTIDEKGLTFIKNKVSALNMPNGTQVAVFSVHNRVVKSNVITLKLEECTSLGRSSAADCEDENDEKRFKFKKAIRKLLVEGNSVTPENGNKTALCQGFKEAFAWAGQSGYTPIIIALSDMEETAAFSLTGLKSDKEAEARATQERKKLDDILGQVPNNARVCLHYPRTLGSNKSTYAITFWEKALTQKGIPQHQISQHIDDLKI